MKAPRKKIYGKSTQGTLILKSTCSGLQRCRWQYWSIFIRLAVVASQICEIPRNSLKIRTHSSSRSSKVSNLGANRKRICDFLLVINSHFKHTSYRFPDTEAFNSKIACFHHPVWCPPSGGTPCGINIIYTPLKSTFNWLQQHRWQYGSIFISIAVVSSKICEITRNSERIAV